MAKKLEELAVYQKALELWTAVTALLDRSAFRRDRQLRDQISEANDSIASNIAEGFEQSTDRAFARYLVIAKGSVAEVCTRLRQARLKRHITEDDLSRCLAIGEQLSRMLARFIRYLAQSDFKDRGRFRLGLNETANDETTRDGGRPGTKDPGPRDPEPRDPGPRDQRPRD
jgi:four helix bundle protein